MEHRLDYPHLHPEGCQSGRMGRPRTTLWVQAHRGFTSHLLRSARMVFAVKRRPTPRCFLPLAAPATLADVHVNRRTTPRCFLPLAAPATLADVHVNRRTTPRCFLPLAAPATLADVHVN